MSASFVPKDRKDSAREKKAIQRWEKEQERLQAAEKMAKDIAEKYREAKKEQSPWATDRIPRDEIDVGDLTLDIYLQMKRDEFEFERTMRDARKKSEQAASLSEKVAAKLRARWKEQEAKRKRKK